ncbi:MULTISPECIES: carbon-nitrogen hydrolase family protein [unclassified Streptomyces]|uniref:carbon-nitrogen hydrolase family protein n=1 Tax=unclassified Streptomyces TaxID=2593676 RepID=UPI002DD8DFFD|nr:MULTISPECIES: carbon-nitrogen hydrolase family protein [unclassified Streptomyces]WSF89080.1 carbon-nitrogen hydrolase family protein [Streptomyces sp. NBC_01744]WSC43159.1 carbon-nitrogen hydrolase family protein [Streptomyces sp. NBC_01762]WSC57980.1 carbon-nitrogen hydrolase family protein [Streptomyces sp. NBC_01761]WSD22696.1 carbon-nitrogen hydrolase family protein [Streptomyces sp. NBC_01751]WSJ55285.1 carbon-nitrogen hydrolase family protein [Streptomyces sp. NBC_01318]
MPESNRVRLAVAQTTVCQDPRESAELHESGREVRRLMQEAHRAGARVAHFTEGATCSPHKRVMSVDGPDRVGPADWNRFEWGVLQQELIATAALARELRLWTVLGSVHRLTPPHRPHNSLYVISDRGDVATRYDERMLSNTKISYMYSPGRVPVTFEVDGVRFGCSLGMETHFPEIFSEYERLDVDCVLFSTTGGAPDDGTFATETQAHASTNRYWTSLSVPAQHSPISPAAVIAPDGRWAARCPQDGTPAVAVTDIDSGTETASALSRPWRRTARAGLYDRYLVQQDVRSDDRSVF